MLDTPEQKSGLKQARYTFPFGSEIENSLASPEKIRVERRHIGRGHSINAILRIVLKLFQYKRPLVLKTHPIPRDQNYTEGKKDVQQ